MFRATGVHMRRSWSGWSHEKKKRWCSCAYWTEKFLENIAWGQHGGVGSYRHPSQVSICCYYLVTSLLLSLRSRQARVALINRRALARWIKSGKIHGGRLLLVSNVGRLACFDFSKCFLSLWLRDACSFCNHWRKKPSVKFRCKLVFVNRRANIFSKAASSILEISSFCKSSRSFSNQMKLFLSWAIELSNESYQMIGVMHDDELMQMI